MIFYTVGCGGWAPNRGIESWLGDAGNGYGSLIELGDVFPECDD